MKEPSPLKNKYLLVALSACLLAASYPPLPLGFLAHIALVPLLISLWDTSGRETFKLAYIWGLLFAILMLHWISWINRWVTLGGMILAALYIALFPAFIFWLFIRIKRVFNQTVAFLLFPFLWVGMEYIRGSTDLGFPWQDLGHTQIPYIPLVQFADILGSRGISFWVIILNILFFLLLSSLKLKKVALYILLLAIAYSIPLGYGEYILHNKEEMLIEDFPVALLQGNVDPRKKWEESLKRQHFDEYIAMMKKYGKNMKLVVWPESATANYFRKEPYYRNKLKRVVEELNVPAVVGVLDYRWIGEEVHYYNAAVLLMPDGTESWYYKNHLVPFSEHFPFDQNIDFFRKLNRQVNFGQGDFTPGKKKPIMNVWGKKFGIIICFESVFPSLVREFVENGAEFIVLITNDGWFGKSVGAYQHAEIARLRAVENRVPIARCANTGITCLIDPYGRVYNKLGLMKQGVVTGNLRFVQKRTFFTRYGECLPKAGALIIPLALIGGMLKRV